MDLLLGERGKAEFLEGRVEKVLALSGHAGRDRRLIHQLVGGITRWEATLDWLIDQRTSGRRQRRLVRVLLRLGLFQLFWMDRIPPHAAVFETVAMAKRRGLGAESGMINAVLRGCERAEREIRNQLEALRQQRPWLGYSHPEWLWKRWSRQWGREAAIELMKWNNRPPPCYVRTNTLRIEADVLHKQWSKAGVAVKPFQAPWLNFDGIFLVEPGGPVTALPGFKEGWFYIQDPSTLVAPLLLAPQPGERLVDACAAPGGKTTFIAQLSRNRAHIAAYEKDEGRRGRLRENCRRLGVANLEIINRLDGLPPGRWDGILVDAPCSNTGVLARRLELRRRLSPAEIHRLQYQQGEILKATAPLVRPTGRLVYSTCSLEPEENQEIIRTFLKSHPQFTSEQEIQTLPFRDGVDGAYAVRLRRQ